MRFNIERSMRRGGWHCQKRGVAVQPGRGFTLIEALIAMVLLGLAITALLVANRSASVANGEGLEMSTAEFLAEQIREGTVTKPFATLVTTYPNNTTVSYLPPHDSQGTPLTAYSAYSQKIKGQYVSPSDLSTPSGTSPFYRITVDVYLNNEKKSSVSWLRANY